MSSAVHLRAGSFHRPPADVLLMHLFFLFQRQLSPWHSRCLNKYTQEMKCKRKEVKTWKLSSICFVKPLRTFILKLAEHNRRLARRISEQLSRGRSSLLLRFVYAQLCRSAMSKFDCGQRITPPKFTRVRGTRTTHRLRNSHPWTIAIFSQQRN